MKTRLFFVSALAVAAIAFVGCNKIESSIEVINNNGYPFEFTASQISSKTVNDGVSTNWAADDNVNLFHAVAGSTSYISDGEFTASEAGESVTFTGTLAEELTADNYDWYAIYPYNTNISTPANTGTKGYVTIGSAHNGTQAQTGNNSKAHLAGNKYPVAGKATNVAKDTKPVISFAQLSSVIAVKVTNGTESPITVSEVSFTGTERINGTFYIDFVSSPVVYTSSGDGYTDNTADLTVTSGTPIAVGDYATFYLAVKPFTAPAAGTISLSVTADNGEQVRNKELEAAATFAAGKINTLNFTYDKASSVATLPFSIDGTGGYAAYSSTTGVLSSGVTTDYSDSHSPYLAKFDTDGDYVQVHFNAAAGSASIGVKKIGGAGNSSFDVMGSADGVSFTKIETLNITGAQNATMTLETSNVIDASYRYIRFVFIKSANVGVGPISISKPSTAPTINANSVSDVPVTGGEGRTLIYTIENFAGEDDVAVTAYDGSVVTAAEVTSPGTVTYTVANNYGSATANGSITLYSANEDISKVITVSQLGETFATTAAATITLDKDATSDSFTITTPSYGWSSTVTPSDGKNLTISPISGAANASAQTITINSNTAVAASEQTLGTIVLYRDGNESDPQKITITIKKASNSGGASLNYTEDFSSTPIGTSTTYNSGTWGGASSTSWSLTYGSTELTSLSTYSLNVAIGKKSESGALSFSGSNGITAISFDYKAQGNALTMRVVVNNGSEDVYSNDTAISKNGTGSVSISSSDFSKAAGTTFTVTISNQTDKNGLQLGEISWTAAK
jgi:hypothetical protein